MINISRGFKKIDLHKLVPRSASKGEVPGTVEYVGKKRTKPIKITVLDYDEKSYEEKEISIKDFAKYTTASRVSWINVYGVYDTKTVQAIGDAFGIHQLSLEDISNTTQRPTFEEHEKYLFMILKMLYLDENQEVIIEQVSLVVGDNWIISFQETETGVLEPLRNQIRQSKGRIRKLKNDYLTFSIIDSIVDNYFKIIEITGEKVEIIEEQVMNNPNPKVQESIYRLKRRLIYLKKSVWPMREVISRIAQADHKVLNRKTRVYFRDTYDHIVQVIDGLESLREIVSGIMDLYLSSISNKMNEVMKMLTVFASIFIPLTFVAGIYGMNFEYMPELSWEWGYAGFWIFIVLLTSSLLFYFKKKKWL